MDKKILLHFKKTDPILYEIAKTMELQTSKRTDDYFTDLVQTIINQQLSSKAADTIFGRFRKMFPNEKVNAKDILEIKDEKIREAGISFSKIKYIKGVSQEVVDRKLDLNKFDNESDDMVIEELVKLKGIGQWSAEMFLMFSLKREDVFSFGDQGLKNAIKKIYKLKEGPTILDLEKISIKWKPYRTYAARILWTSLG